MKYIYLILITIVLTACGNGRDVTVVSYNKATSPTLKKDYVIVQAGDNLYAIATQNKVPTAELVKKNGIKPPFNLKLGQKIYLPKIKYHRVKKGETLYALARKYRVSVQGLANVNNFSKRTKLNKGAKINIPRTPEELKKIVPRSTQTYSNKSVKSRSKNDSKAVKNKSSVKKQVKLRKIKELEIKKLAVIKKKQKARLKRRISNKTPKPTGRFIYPVKGKVISSFGRKSGGVSNDGINISVKKGTKIKASENGVVVYTGNGLKNFGNVVLIKHSKSYVTVYAHLNRISVGRGDVVKQGAKIGTVGSTGNVKNSQLHFQIRKRRQILNPEKYLR